jgi:uncharacterized protein
MRQIMMASALALATVATAAPIAAAQAQTMLPVQTINGTRLDVVATGEVTRVPDIARISTGVITTATTASAALEQNAVQMRKVRDALRKAGIADNDIQTSSINLYPDYRQDERGGGNPQLIGYRAQNEVTVRFRDIANTGKILDALVAQGANQINGPSLSVDKPEAALDEARTAAIAKARARAELYAKAAGMSVKRIVAISEGGDGAQPPRPMVMMMARSKEAADTTIEAGEQKLSVSVSVTFELQ